MIDLIKPVDSIFFLNTKLFSNCLEGVSEEIYLKRLNDASNNIAFIACHLIDARFYIGSFCGVEIVNPYKEVFDRIKSPGQTDLFPPLKKVAELWKEISIPIENKFKIITGAELQKEAPLQLPLTERTILGGLTFFMQHESFHIGQLALIRKYSGLPAMKYV
jgi:hypothetical protein